MPNNDSTWHYFLLICAKLNVNSMSKYRIIALDLDGTLTKSDKTISPHTHDVLVEAQQKGMKVVLASGRPTNGMAYLADELRMSEYGGTVLAFNGGEITDWTTKQILNQVVLPDDVLPLLHDFAQRKGFTIMTYCGKQIFTVEEDNKYVMQSAFRNRMEIVVVDDFLKATREWGRLPKCMVVGDPDKLESFEQEMHEYAKGQPCMQNIDFFRSEPYYLEIVPKGIDKGECLQIVLDHYGMNREELIACGDAYNDMGMIRFAGLGVAMGNAQDCVKEVSDYITDSNDADGVAKVVERFML